MTLTARFDALSFPVRLAIVVALYVLCFAILFGPGIPALRTAAAGTLVWIPLDSLHRWLKARRQ